MNTEQINIPDKQLLMRAIMYCTKQKSWIKGVDSKHSLEPISTERCAGSVHKSQHNWTEH